MWDHIAKSGKHAVLYGTGNACERIMKLMEERGIAPSAIFASDGFVRGKVFHGFPVESYSDVKNRLGAENMTVLLCFGTHRPEVLETIDRISSETELLAPDIAVIPEYGEDGREIIFDSACRDRYAPELALVRSMLEDEQSRKVFDSVISYRLSGELKHLRNCETPQEETWLLTGMKEGWSLLDLGAYTGDTAELFARLLRGRTGRITAVEPDARNLRRLEEKSSQIAGLSAVRAAAGEKEGSVLFSKGGGRGSLQKKKEEVPVVTIDGLCRGSAPKLIKFDIEGSELAALRGGERTIREQAPSMIVSAYHRVFDMWEIPLFVKQLRPDYRVFLRRGTCVPNWELDYIFRL